MAKNQLTSPALRDGEVRRADLCTTVAADAVIAKVIAGTGGISITQTGAAAGTGDVTINLTAATNIAITDNNSLNVSVFPVWVDTTLGGGNYPPKISSTKISFNPSTGLLSLAGGITYGGKITAGVDTADSKLAIGSMEFHAHGLNNNWIADNLYYSAAVRYRAAGYGSFIRFLNGQISLHNWINGAAGAAVTTEAKYQFKADYLGGVAMGGTMTSYTPGDYTGCAMVVKLGVAIGGVTDPGAGNLSIGAVPSIGLGTYCGLIIGNTALIAPKTIATGNFFHLAQNVLYDGFFWRTIVAEAGTSYVQAGGRHSWVTCASGGAGGIATLNERMRLYESGGLFLGITPADPGVGNLWVSGGLAIGGSIAPVANRLSVETTSTGDQTLISLRTPNAVGNHAALDFSINNAGSDLAVARIRSNYLSSGSIGLSFHTYSSGLGERMRLYPTGGLCVGSTLTDPGVNYISVFGGYKVAGTQVVRAQMPSWGLPTGTLSRAALSNASAQAAFNQALMALITDLHISGGGHGLIGP